MRLIDADVLKEWIDEYVSVFKKSDNKDIKGYIEHQPTIEPKRGEWRFDEKGYFFCSECRCKPNDQIRTTDFCPACGADMRGADDE